MWKRIGPKTALQPQVRFPELVVVAIARETDTCSRLEHFHLYFDRGLAPQYRSVSPGYSDCGGFGTVWFISALPRERLPDRFQIRAPYPSTERVWFARDRSDVASKGSAE